MIWQDVYVSEVRERCLICYDTCKADLFALKEKAKTQRIGYRTFDDGTWNAGTPVRLRKKTVNRLYVETGCVTRNFVCRHR